MGLAQRGEAQVAVALVVAAARERDLARMATQVGAALGQHRAQLVLVAIERDQHSRVGLAAHVERDRVLDVEQDALQKIAVQDVGRDHRADYIRE